MRFRVITLLQRASRGITRTFPPDVLNNRLVARLDKGGILHEGQAEFRVNRSCMDKMFTFNELVQGRLRENKHTYAFFLDV